jgi:hypothetical protein
LTSVDADTAVADTAVADEAGLVSGNSVAAVPADTTTLEELIDAARASAIPAFQKYLRTEVSATDRAYGEALTADLSLSRFSNDKQTKAVYAARQDGAYQLLTSGPTKKAGSDTVADTTIEGSAKSHQLTPTHMYAIDAIATIGECALHDCRLCAFYTHLLLCIYQAPLPLSSLSKSSAHDTLRCSVQLFGVTRFTPNSNAADAHRNVALHEPKCEGCNNQGGHQIQYATGLQGAPHAYSSATIKSVLTYNTPKRIHASRTKLAFRAMQAPFTGMEATQETQMLLKPSIMDVVECVDAWRARYPDLWEDDEQRTLEALLQKIKMFGESDAEASESDGGQGGGGSGAPGVQTRISRWKSGARVVGALSAAHNRAKRRVEYRKAYDELYQCRSTSRTAQPSAGSVVDVLNPSVPLTSEYTRVSRLTEATKTKLGEWAESSDGSAFADLKAAPRTLLLDISLPLVHAAFGIIADLITHIKGGSDFEHPPNLDKATLLCDMSDAKRYSAIRTIVTLIRTKYTELESDPQQKRVFELAMEYWYAQPREFGTFLEDYQERWQGHVNERLLSKQKARRVWSETAMRDFVPFAHNILLDAPGRLLTTEFALDIAAAATDLAGFNHDCLAYAPNSTCIFSLPVPKNVHTAIATFRHTAPNSSEVARRRRAQAQESDAHVRAHKSYMEMVLVSKIIVPDSFLRRRNYKIILSLGKDIQKAAFWCITRSWRTRLLFQYIDHKKPNGGDLSLAGWWDRSHNALSEIDEFLLVMYRRCMSVGDPEFVGNDACNSTCCANAVCSLMLSCFETNIGGICDQITEGLSDPSRMHVGLTYMLALITPIKIAQERRSVTFWSDPVNAGFSWPLCANMMSDNVPTGFRILPDVLDTTEYTLGFMADPVKLFYAVRTPKKLGNGSMTGSQGERAVSSLSSTEREYLLSTFEPDQPRVNSCTDSIEKTAKVNIMCMWTHITPEDKLQYDDRLNEARALKLDAAIKVGDVAITHEMLKNRTKLLGEMGQFATRLQQPDGRVSQDMELARKRRDAIRNLRVLHAANPDVALPQPTPGASVCEYVSALQNVCSYADRMVPVPRACDMLKKLRERPPEWIKNCKLGDAPAAPAAHPIAATNNGPPPPGPPPPPPGPPPGPPPPTRQTPTAVTKTVDCSRLLAQQPPPQYVSGSLYDGFRKATSLKCKELFQTLLAYIRERRGTDTAHAVVACILALVINATFGRGGPNKTTSFIDTHMLCGLVDVEKLKPKVQQTSGVKRDALAPGSGSSLPLLPHLDAVFRRGMDEKFGAHLSAALTRPAELAPHVQSFGSSRRFV